MLNDPKNSLKLDWAIASAMTDLGKVRSDNEDRYLLQAWDDESAILAVVADGMGGGRGGAEAARIAIDVLAELTQKPLPEQPKDRYQQLLQGFHDADQKIRDIGSQSFQLLGMGTTIVAAIITPNDYLYLHAGDSRFYHFRKGQFVSQSADHSVVQILLELEKITPEEVRDHPMRSLVNSCLGGRSATGNFAVDPKWDDETQPIYTTQPGDLFLLCSDGLHGMMLPQTLRDLVSQYPDDPEQLTEQLRHTAMEAGGEDNITMIAVQFPSTQP